MDNDTQLNIQEDEIDLLELGQQLLKKIHLIILSAVIFGAAAFGITYYCITPQYQADIALYVSNTAGTNSISILTQSDITASARLVDTYSAFIRNKEILRKVLRAAEIDDLTYQELRKKISVKSVDNTEVFQVFVTDSDPERAAILDNAIADVTLNVISEYIVGSSIMLLNRADVPEIQASPSIIKNTAAGVMFGLLFAAMIVIIISLLSRTIHEEKDLRRWEPPLLGALIEFDDVKQMRSSGSKKKKKSRKLKKNEEISYLLTDETPFAVAEAYRTTAANIMLTLLGKQSKSIVVSSAMQGEGKSTTTVNLAIALSANKKKVILIDCDLRLPTIGDKLGLDSKPGLMNLLTGTNSAGDVIHTINENLDVITAGDTPPNPIEVLGSEQMDGLIEVLEKKYDYILFDTPPINTVSDAVVLSKKADGVILVVRQDFATIDSTGEALRQLQFAGSNVIGFVLSHVRKDKLKQYRKGYGYGKYGDYGYGKKK